MTLLALLACGDPGRPSPVDTADDSGETADTADTADTSDTGGGETDSGPDTAPAEDADGDGVPAPDDCDDEDARVYPGAADWCDGVDQDCDGDPVGTGMCGEVGTIDDLDTWYWTGLHSNSIFFVGWVVEMDGETLQIGRTVGFESASVSTSGQTFFLMRGLPPDPEGWPDQLVGAWLGDDDRQVWGIWPAGDFDGDGVEDLWVGTMNYDRELAHLRLQQGPASAWEPGGVYGSDVDYATWSDGLDNNETIGSDTLTHGRDIDGDGLADYVTGARRGVTVLFGRTDGLAGEHDFTGESWVEDDAALGYQKKAFSSSDFDGDGAREVTLGGGDWLVWLDGASLRGMAGNPLSEVANLLTREDGSVWTENRPIDVGDLDGDGTDDLLVGLTDNDSDVEGYCLGWLSGHAIPTASTLEETTIARACGRLDAFNWSSFTRGDVDEDGVGDVTISLTDDMEAELGFERIGCLVATSRLPLGGTLDLAEAAPCFSGLSIPVPDLDGDGLADFIAYNTEWDEDDRDNVGRTDLLPGFLIPWDDPTKW